MNLNESLAWTRGHHLVQAGFQLPDWSRRGFYDRTNFGGTFYFSGLDTYDGGRPYTFTQQGGNGDVAFLEKQVGAYIKDDWQIVRACRSGLGVRYDWQNYFHDDNNVAPRLSVAYCAGEPEDKRDSRRRRRLQRSQRSGRHRRRAALVAWRHDAHRDRESRLPRSVLVDGAGRVPAEKHRAAGAGCADSADAPIRRRPRPSASESDNALNHIYRRAGISPVSIPRRERAATAVLPRRGRIRRTA